MHLDVVFEVFFNRPKFLQKQVAVKISSYHSGLFSSLIFVFYPAHHWASERISSDCMVYKRLGFAFVIIFTFYQTLDFFWLVLKNRTFSKENCIYNAIGKIWFARHLSTVFPSHYFCHDRICLYVSALTRQYLYLHHRALGRGVHQVPGRFGIRECAPLVA